ncbi:MAG: hypothetical protein K2X39_00805, partial [Silvanigrellaceae bacterium]|nr:hypothetical protein [Silvanigrellaceae bacterium]
EAIQFSQKPTPEQMTQMLEALPKLIRLQLAAQSLQQLGWAIIIDEPHFFENFYEAIKDQELQSTLLKSLFERLMQTASMGVEGLIGLAERYISNNPAQPSLQVLSELCAQYKTELDSLKVRAKNTDNLELHRESFTKFLQTTMQPDAALVTSMPDSLNDNEANSVKAFT